MTPDGRASGWLRRPAMPGDAAASEAPTRGWLHSAEVAAQALAETAEIPQRGWLVHAAITPDAVAGEQLPSSAANADILPADTGRRFHWPRPGRRAAIALSVLGGLLVLSFAGAAYATYDYSQRYDGKILPGATIAGVDVGGMTESEAIAAVRVAIGPQLDRDVTVRWADKSWDVTPRSLGARSNARAAVRAALDASSSTSFVGKMGMRVFGTELDFTRDVAITHPRKGVQGFIEGIAAGLDQEPRDAFVDYSSGWVKLKPALEGREVRTGRSRAMLMDALESGEDIAPLAVATEQPEVMEQKFEQILLLRIGENKLYLYEDGKITHEWVVATGQPEYPTPTGEYEVELKRYMPTWINPDPEGWGASMPASIPPGIGNPLGLRAINWTAPAIRFHGTSATYSLGYNASHGCVRMANEDVIELYDMIDIGTPIISTIVAPLRPMYVSAPDPTVVEEDADEDQPTADAGDAEEEKSGGAGGDSKPGKGDG